MPDTRCLEFFEGRQCEQLVGHAGSHFYHNAYAKIQWALRAQPEGEDVVSDCQHKSRHWSRFESGLLICDDCPTAWKNGKEIALGADATADDKAWGAMQKWVDTDD